MNFPFLIYPLLAALMSGDLSKDVIWQHNNKQQQYFLENYFQKKSELKKINRSELKAWFSQDHIALNKSAKENGFSNQFKPLSKNEIGMLSSFNLEQKWVQKNYRYWSTYNEKNYEAIKIDSNFEVLKSDFHYHFFVKINSDSGDKIYLTFADKDKVNNNEFDFFKNIEYLSKLKKEKYTPRNYDCLFIPKINYSKEFNVNWLNGISANGLAVKQCLQKVNLKFDIVEQLDAFVRMSGIIKSMNPFVSRHSYFEFDAPFYLWIEREGCSSPIFAAYIDETSWVQIKSFLETVNEKIDL